MWAIQPVKTAILHTPGPEVFFQRDFTRRVELAIYSFILRSSTRTVLLDTGLGEHAALNADVRERKGEWSGFKLVEPRPEALRDLVVDDIVLTTFGPYAVGGLDIWPDARVHYSSRGWRDLQTPEIPLFQRRLAPSHHARLAGGGGCALYGRSRIADGLELVELGAHSPSALGAVIETGDGVVAIADPIFHSENLTRGVPLGWVESLAEWYAMFGKLGPSVTAILPIHDPSGELVPRREWRPELIALAQRGERS